MIAVFLVIGMVLGTLIGLGIDNIGGKDWSKWEIVDENIDVLEKQYNNITEVETAPIKVKADRLRRVCKKTGDIEYKLVKRN